VRATEFATAGIARRLKKAEELEENKNHTAGHKAGLEWAQNKAKPSQLRRLAKAVEMSWGDGEGEPNVYVFTLTEHDANTAGPDSSATSRTAVRRDIATHVSSGSRCWVRKMRL
jgi:hypothetical protein